MNLKKIGKKLLFKTIKPFLPLIIFIFLIFLCICTIIDAVFIQEVQTDDSSLSSEQLELKNKCISVSEQLNTCHNYNGDELTNYLLDVNNRENDKLIEWSHLYAIMSFHNMCNNKKINEKLLNDVSKSFESTFKYQAYTATTTITSQDETGNTITTTSETTQYILVESDTIIGHYKYNYEDKTVQENNSTSTTKVFIGEELIGEKYERLKNYLRKEFHIKDDELDNDVKIIIEASNRLLSR